MSDDDDKIIPLFKNMQEFSHEDHAWEEMVDLTLEEHQEYIDQMIRYSRDVSSAIEDLSRDIEDLKKALRIIINKLK